jgi:membrane-bound lytic murein transglycosylase F
VEDSIQRVKFTLASFNCGYSHVVDAQTLAEMEGKDPKIWDGQVEDMILKLSYRENYTKPGINYGYVRGIEPFTYVRQIFNRYEHYVQLIE